MIHRFMLSPSTKCIASLSNSHSLIQSHLVDMVERKRLYACRTTIFAIQATKTCVLVSYILQMNEQTYNERIKKTYSHTHTQANTAHIGKRSEWQVSQQTPVMHIKSVHLFNRWLTHRHLTSVSFRVLFSPYASYIHLYIVSFTFGPVAKRALARVICKFIEASDLLFLPIQQ